ncbi:MAG: RNA polymerase sigma factor (sigma-70 family) [Myxococcota bacterium]|jgi:RNA polymerase sigma factor (sigma-70 family)
MRITAEQEREIALDIRQAEQRALSAVIGINAAEEVLRIRPKRAERTKAGAVERLEQAVRAAREASRGDPTLKTHVNQAEAALADSERLRWRLAMSARHIARGEARKLVSSLMGEEDLVQEGYIGLLRAARRFDPDRGIRFTTYARWWVRAQMTRAIETTGRTVRLPGGAVEQIRNLRRAAARLDQEGIDYNLADLAAEVGLEKKRAELLLRQGGVVSIDQTDDDGLSVGDRLPSEIDAPDETAYRSEAISNIQSAFDDLLDERERFILMHHYGLEGLEAKTMADIGKRIGLSRERVRQIEVGALMRLRTRI